MGQSKPSSTCSHVYILAASGAGNERGDGAIFELLKDSGKEKVLEVVWAMISHNQPVSTNRAIKKIAEVRERRLGRGVQQMLMEKPLDNHQGRTVGVKRQVEKASLLVNPPVLVEHGSFCVGEGFGKKLSKYIGRIAAVAETEEEGP
jgi:hypothetical protein